MKLSSVLTTSLAVLTLFASASSEAHRVWIKPSATIVSGDSEWITFDAAIANGIFYPDHYPLGLDRVKAMAPDGAAVTLENGHKGKLRSVFDVELEKEGTYTVYSASSGLSARWVDAEGERQYWPPRGSQKTNEDFYKEVPQNAKDLEVSERSHRVETFVTSGAPTYDTLGPTGKGLELEPVTHPNDLYTGENITFKFNIDGTAAAGTEIVLVKDGERYRDQSQPTKLKTDKKGEVTFTLNEPGMYWLEAEYTDNNGKAPASKRQGSYVAVLEVLPM
ncbi:MAG TPA: DUF4198 domain-containing protein [Idiomarina abyssalis]|jgi:uncharacterized GH25 family protein|uniref:DUF4198 domain-containing protein n=1 Tax=Idiomarina abyssalis TaxID=86102 RepID=UPI000E396E00|nr:DUF4198 domain-containing protein [Idiomarina abyssalis]RDX34495.1 DUF4198 domain-containing protein [Idiomarina sp. HD9-110m-PIT-SAG05]HAS16198.1 DUF4198 domain-containing protein [Idiomarina abyssalis]|tara:strand:- start:204 stop:1034 length:831 start_codon:yes stop_codon:yes gene_type:complete